MFFQVSQPAVMSWSRTCLPPSVSRLQWAFVVEMSWQLQNEPLKEQSTLQGNTRFYLYILTYMWVLPGIDPTISYLPWIVPISQSFSNMIFLLGYTPKKSFTNLAMNAAYFSCDQNIVKEWRHCHGNKGKELTKKHRKLLCSIAFVVLMLFAICWTESELAPSK